MDTNNDNDPNDKCGYESLWIGLKCKNSPLIDKYKLDNFNDLYKLLRYGNAEYPTLFEDDNVTNFLKNCDSKFKQLCDEFKNDSFNKNIDGVWPCYFPLVSLYFNIRIILNGNTQHVSNNLLKLFNIEPLETLELITTPIHVEYKPLENEKDTYNKLKHISECKKINYNEYIEGEELDLILNADIDTDDSLDDWFDINDFI